MALIAQGKGFKRSGVRKVLCLIEGDVLPPSCPLGRASGADKSAKGSTLDGALVTHVAYGDEASYNVGRYRAVAVVTMTTEEAPGFSRALAEILATSDVRESKWNRIKTARSRFAAEKMLREFFGRTVRGTARADVLIWDTSDRRHTVPRRDDPLNLAIMYHHLCRKTFGERWPEGSSWAVYPDEHTAIEWPDLRNTLSYVGIREALKGGRLSDIGQRGYKVVTVQPQHSHEEPLIQLADLLAGIGVYSWSCYAEYEQWLTDHGPAPTLFGNADEPLDLSNGDRARCPLLHQVDTHCKAQKWQVALKSKRGLYSHDPSRGRLNFWLWESQHDGDRAPTRPKRS